MSDNSNRPAVQTIVIALVLTGAVTAAAYYTWIYANIGARTYARGTLLTDMRFFVGLLAVFVALTFADRIIGFIVARIGGRKT
ncbi:hypothetical protein [Roseibium alexandrii]|uniref:Uncharacterized protein n=1 Tax=Roseibium alexandrii (strain DSM 17067 / NCIMB 14079 / DFL-11) TaxID=244592 RepID=A0A5E8GZP4_ROSAD|nr:hypothetical protein [Roseibium alexandrii]EEE45415.1 hypothetical protein SADFL11_2704 [Roseibium alexandrii DFL-11]